jgi:3-methyladenine DNA glycosylase/8-oxoguanine DNA glycosylase
MSCEKKSKLSEKAKIMKIKKPEGFKFIPTVLSHGWYELPPFKFDVNTGVLERVIQLKTGKIVDLRIYEDLNYINIEIASLNPVSEVESAEVISTIQIILNLSQDLTAFYASLTNEHKWIIDHRLGRLLISPTVWEDVVKTILTTNTTWNITVAMSQRLTLIGEKSKEGKVCFPTPQKVASMDLATLNSIIRAGYRAEYIHTLANTICEEKINIELWRQPGIPTNELYKHIKSIKGVGDYAAGSILKLLGRFDQIGIDSACRTVFQENLNNGIKATDNEIQNYYEKFGRWRGLVSWFDIMQVNLDKVLTLNNS